MNKKRDQKLSSKVIENQSKDVSPSLHALGNIGSLISGQAQGGVAMKRKTSEGQSLLDNIDLKNLANNVKNLCAKEYTRRLSGHLGIREQLQDEEKQSQGNDDIANNLIGTDNIGEKRNSF